MIEVHGTPNVERFARLLLELLAEQDGLCVTEFRYEKAPAHGGNRERAAR